MAAEDGATVAAGGETRTAPANPGGTNNGTALLGAYARNPNGTWVDYSDARQTYRDQTNALGPLGTF